MIIQDIKERTSKISYQGLVMMFVGLLFLFFAGLMFLFLGPIKPTIEYFLYKHPFAYLGILLPGLIAYILLAFFRTKINNMVLFILMPIVVVYFSFTISVTIVDKVSFQNGDNLFWMGAILTTPALIIFVAGIIGYFELVNLQKLSTLTFFLFIPFVLLVILNIFIRSSLMFNAITVIGILLISASSVFTINQIKKEQAFYQYATFKEMWKSGLFKAYDLFIDYVLLLSYILRFSK
ncbi:MAG0110 family membrane protein [Mycoplasma sp. Ms02]|uniref:MAG0110 family membrane protein n=1 Tax=Mycoplasma sp. Ms02 TaxID=353851 RepID=UPI001C89F282|nr:hypothetical protein [Mycoplasma sp. Ms02]QZE12297.1 hypothetical protein K4L35_03110 [Mycoplasma sp. Ms02]